MLETLELTCENYLKIFQDYKSHENIKGGTIWQFLKESHIKYYGGKCPIYCILHTHNNQEIEIGFVYATMGKPSLEPFQKFYRFGGNKIIK